MNRKTSILFIGLILAAGGYWWTQKQASDAVSPDQAVTQRGNQEQAGIPEEGRDQATTSTDQAGQSEQKAAAIREQFYSAQKAAKARQQRQRANNPGSSAQVSVDFDAVHQEVKHALEGDPKALLKLSRDSLSCLSNSLASDDDILRTIDYLDGMKERFDPNTQANKIQALDRTVETQYRQYENCAWKYTDAATPVRDRLQSTSESGDVVARFVYATALMPSPLEADYHYQFTLWADNAVNFTMDNIMRRETLGFVAMALSYNRGLFTPRDPYLSDAWYYVAANCTPKGVGFSPAEMSGLFGTLNSISSTAESLGQQMVRMYCF